MSFDNEKDYRRSKWERKKSFRVKKDKSLSRSPKKSIYENEDENVDIYEGLERNTLDNDDNW
jgi:hypothetical protein